ncbi:MAG: gliding motility-associated C-terminal domain-containing protein [Saprospiraceae bacterium]
MRSFIIILLLTFVGFTNLTGQWVYLLGYRSTQKYLQRINLTTLEVLDVVRIPSPELTDIAFHPNGTLYCVEFSKLSTLDTLTGARSLITTLPGFEAVGMTFDFKGLLYLSGIFTSTQELAIITYNLTSGSIYKIASFLPYNYSHIDDLDFYNGSLYAVGKLPLEFANRQVLFKVDTINQIEHDTIVAYDYGQAASLASISDSCGSEFLVSNSNIGQFDYFYPDLHSILTVDVPGFPGFKSGGFTSLTSWMGSFPPLGIDSINIQSDPCLDVSTIIANPKKGRSGIQYSLDNGPFQVDSIFTNVLSGLHSITMMDDKGCTYLSETFHINKPDLDTFFIIEINEATCGENNGQIIITDQLNVVNTEYSVDGMNWQLQPMLTNLAGGSYTLYIRLPSGCKDSIEVFIPTELSVGVMVSTFSEHCEMKDGRLEILTTGGQPPFAFMLSNGINSTVPFFDSLASGNYLLSITDFTGCTTDINVKVSKQPYGIDSIKIENEICNNQNGSFEITLEGGSGPYSYSLDSSGQQGTPTFYGLSSGKHSIQVVDTFGCILDTSFQIISINSLPLFNVEFSNATCNESNGSILVHTESMNDLISLDFNEFQNIPLYDSLTSGMHFVTVLNEDGCKDTSGVFIAQAGSPVIGQMQAIPEHCDKKDGTIEILETTGGVSPYQFNIDGSQFVSSNIFQDIDSGPHVISVIDINGCTYTTIVNIDDVSGPIIENIDVISSSCAASDGEIFVHALGESDLTFQINNINNENGLFVGLISGNYNVEVTDEFGCEISIEVNVSNETHFTLGNIEINSAQCNQPTGGFSVSGEVEISIEELPGQSWTSIATELRPGTYHVLLTNQSGCQYDTIITIPSNCDLFLPNVFSPNGDNINDLFGTYEGVTSLFWEMEIFDRSGNLVYLSNDSSIGWDGFYKGKECQVGVYVWKLRYRLSDQESNMSMSGDVTLIR